MNRVAWLAVAASFVFLLTGCPSHGAVDSGFGGGGFVGGGFGGNGGGFTSTGGGTGGGSSTGGGGGSSTGGGAATGGGSGTGGGGGQDTIGPLVATQLWAGMSMFGPTWPTTHLEPTEHRLYNFPAVTAPNLKFISTLRTVGDGADLPDGGPQSFAEALPVTGAMPAGVVSSAAVDPGSGALVAVMMDAAYTHYTVVSMTVTGGAANVTTLSSVGAPSSQYFAYPLSAYGPGQFVVDTGNASYTIAIANGTATWTPVTQPGSQHDPELISSDGPHAREVAFGDRTYSGSFMFSIAPTVMTRALPTGAWTVVATSGDGPPTVNDPQSAIYTSWSALDDTTGTLYASVIHQVSMFGGQLQWVYGLWSCDVATGVWTKLNDTVGYNALNFVPIADPTMHQLIIGLQPNWVQMLSVGSPMPGTGSAGRPDGLISLDRPASGVLLNDGRVVISSDGYLYVSSATDPTWRKFSSQALPNDVYASHALAFDSKTGKLLLLGGSTTTLVLDVALDGSGFTPLVTTNAPAPRSGYSLLARDGVLYLAGGATDTWALDLGQLSWRQVGSLPAVRSRAAIQVVANELWLVGGIDATQSMGVPSIVALDLSTGAARTVTADGPWPVNNGNWWAWAPLGDGIVAIDSGDEVDSSTNQLWTLDPTPSGGAHFTSMDPQVSDYALDNLIGAAGDRHHAMFVGTNSWLLSR